MKRQSLDRTEERHPKATAQRGCLTEADRRLKWLYDEGLDANVVACRLGECAALVPRTKTRGATAWFCCAEHRIEYGRRRESLRRCIEDALKLLAELEGYEPGTVADRRARTARGRQIEGDLKYLRGVALAYGPLDERAAKVSNRRSRPPRPSEGREG